MYCNDIQIVRALQNFDRTEFSNEKLRSAPTTTGATPLITTGFGNQPIQLLTTCTGDVARPLGPDDANIPLIKQRFNILRYEISGSANKLVDMIALYQMWADHAVRLNRFDLYLGEQNMNLSITHLTNVLQAQTFSYLTSTGLSLSGNAISGTVTNMLITNLQQGVEYEVPLTDGSGNSLILQDFKLTIENRVVTSQGINGAL
jgi:hypothetical protein